MQEISETICAISTSYGVGGIAVIRVSGCQAIAIAEQLVGRSLPRSVQYCRIADLDDVVISVFRAPHSFTGEDVVEISCHGSLYIQQEFIRRLIQLGCRQARGGEFTQRAFLNGKLDLSQAEAVADLIAAQTKAEKDLALGQLRGAISGELDVLRDKLLKLTSLLELELDFADHEDLEFADRSELQTLSDEIEQRLERLTASFQTGQAIKNGIPVAIVGQTNAGKSTLLNALLGEERAIVSDIAGTTRDTIEDTLVIDGVLFRLIDTAGIRETDDHIEQMGIARSRQAIEKAQIVIHLIDATQPEEELHIDGKEVLQVYNKVDLVPSVQGICAKKGELGMLKEQLVAAAGIHHTDGAMISSMRHYEALCRGLEAIRRVKKGITEQISGEFITMDLEDVLNALGEVTGKISSQEVLNNIFSKFCIGK